MSSIRKTVFIFVHKQKSKTEGQSFQRFLPETSIVLTGSELIHVSFDKSYGIRSNAFVSLFFSTFQHKMKIWFWLI